MSIHWREVIRAVAPTIAGLAGGPGVGMAVAELSKLLLGKPDGTEAEVAEAVTKMTPEQYIALKAADSALKQKFIDGGVRLEELTVDDRKDARKNNAGSNMPAYLTFLTVCGVAIVAYYVITGNAPGVKDTVTGIVAGQIIGEILHASRAAFSYWLGGFASDDNALLKQATTGAK